MRTGCPFQQWLVPRNHSNKSPTVPPPLYARVAGFFFSLRSILSNNAEDFEIGLESCRDGLKIVRSLESRTAFDAGQCEAIITALTHEFALVRGPPGTGKSYIGLQLVKVLLENKEKARLGPIIVVYVVFHYQIWDLTNSIGAILIILLTSSWKDLLKKGISNVIRIGGQSKSAILVSKNLRVRSQSEAKRVAERSILREAFSTLQKFEEIITHKIRLLRDVESLDWHAIRGYLQRSHPQVYNQLATGSNGSSALAFAQWRVGSLSKPGPRENIETILRNANRDIYQLSNPSRHFLLKYWLSQIFSSTGRDLFELLSSNNEAKQRQNNVYGEIERRCLQNADVIGVTTAGFAHRVSTLRNVKAKVTICEEAGQILEGHLLSALLPSLEHLIQIGDHSQLRPPINDYNLSVEGPYGYQLDRSMFERLSTSEHDTPISRLNVQRRMRPEISRLLRGTIYPELMDHESVKVIPDVVGMRHNVYWLHHTNPEDRSEDVNAQKSHSNAWEVEMINRLTQHIVRQGVYSYGDIAILTPYSKQEHDLKKKLSKYCGAFSGGKNQPLVPETENVVIGPKHYHHQIRISTM